MTDATRHIGGAETRFEYFFRSGSSLISGQLSRPVGAGPHPAALLLHGLPGWQRNHDLGQALQGAGIAVLTISYRGCWQTPGCFSLENAIADSTEAVRSLADLRPGSLGIDTRRIAVIGHSFGGGMAIHAAAAIGCPVVTLAGWYAGEASHFWADRPRARAAFADFLGETMTGVAAPVRGNPARFLDEVAQASPLMSWYGARRQASSCDLLAIVGSRDEQDMAMHAALSAARRAAGASLQEIVLDDDHGFSSDRAAMIACVVEWMRDRLLSC